MRAPSDTRKPEAERSPHSPLEWVLLCALPACPWGDAAPRNPLPSTATAQAC